MIYGGDHAVDAHPDRAMIAPDARYRRGSAGYRRISAAMFASGLATFALLHSSQAVLPLLSTAFSVPPATASLTVSVATGTLALGVIPVSVLSERFGRRRVMLTAIFVAIGLGLLTSMCPAFAVLLVVRSLQGLALAGLPAVTVAYLAEEIHPDSLAGSVGMVIGGNSLGGLAGRLLAGAVGDLAGWRAGLAAVGVLALGCGVAFAILLPRQRHFQAASLDVKEVIGGLRRHLGDTVLLRSFALGGLVMAAFSTLYNYLGYRLTRPPFSLPQAVVGLVFLAFLAGTASSATAGRLTERVGPRLVLLGAVLVGMVGTALTLSGLLVVILAGVVLHTVGFFGAHSVASGLVGRRAVTARAQASSMYTLTYYVGASIGGWVGGFGYQFADWPGVVCYLLALLGLAVGLAASLKQVSGPPAPAPEADGGRLGA